MLNAKIGVVSGLTLDPVKQVFKFFKCTGLIAIQDNVSKMVFWSDETSMVLRHCSYNGTDCGVVDISQQTRPSGAA